MSFQMIMMNSSVDDEPLKLTTNSQKKKIKTKKYQFYKLTNNEELQRLQAIKYSRIKAR